jgi:hypothetical protein
MKLNFKNKSIIATLILTFILGNSLFYSKEVKANPIVIGLTTCTAPTPLLLVCAATLLTIAYGVSETGKLISSSHQTSIPPNTQSTERNGNTTYTLMGKVYVDATVVADYDSDPITGIPSINECNASVAAICTSYTSIDPTAVCRLHCVSAGGNTVH